MRDLEEVMIKSLDERRRLNREHLNNKLKAIAQRKAMEYYGWDVDTFRSIFGKNYL